jgi:hypothetical protein
MFASRSDLRHDDENVALEARYGDTFDVGLSGAEGGGRSSALLELTGILALPGDEAATNAEQRQCEADELREPRDGARGDDVPAELPRAPHRARACRTLRPGGHPR